MKSHKLILGLILTIVVIVTQSCLDDDKISTNPSYQLSFSADTVGFDTLFTGITSTTVKLKVYNRNKERVRISDISLFGGANSPFKINVLGRSSENQSFSDIEIQGKDSLYLSIRVKLDENHRDQPLLIRDSIRFLTNGNEQKIQLFSVGQDVVVLRNKTVVNDSMITAQKPHLIYGQLTVNEGKTLTIEKGSKLYFYKDAGITINGSLQVLGTEEQPIVMRGHRLDNMFPGVPYDSLPGQWQGLCFNSPTSEHRLEFVTIKNPVTAIRISGNETQKPILTIRNSILHNTDSFAVVSKNARLTVENTQISNSRQNCLFLQGGEYNFAHCTVANYFPRKNLKSKTLLIKNYDDASEIIPYPISAAFKNCIIFGSTNNEIELDRKNDFLFDLSFNGCLLVGEQVLDDNYFVGAIWEKSSTTVFANTKTYPYDFRLAADSPAIDKADMSIAGLYPTDLTGKSRLSDSQADIGAYEY
ncbi:MAG: hypothetical protein LBR81_06075 [Prevotellaceae bacterium]|jgi:hypothetical protein|nr:hypothetical protein [Prevotellaceae bacterium]